MNGKNIDYSWRFRFQRTLGNLRFPSVRRIKWHLSRFSDGVVFRLVDLFARKEKTNRKEDSKLGWRAMALPVIGFAVAFYLMEYYSKKWGIK